ncbi:MAG: FtsQ-type POTRA domain-containing protein [Candidatus Cloacimonetes bacterium]|nr:FtsQ-type POTRA domain-containing protein [Candidatus Cloacimonadota bacterium]
MDKVVRGNSRFVTYAVTIIVALAIVYAGILVFLKQWDKCNISKISFKNNNVITSVQLEKMLQDNIGKNLYNINKQEIANKLLEIYRIEKVKIYRRPLSTLVVSITERRGFLNLITENGTIFTIDSDGVVLSKFNFNDKDDFPIIRTKLNSHKTTPGTLIKDDSVQEIVAYHKKLLEAKPELEKYISEYFKEGNDIFFYEIESGKKILIDTRYLDDNISMFFTLLESIRFDKYNTYIFKYKDKTIRE